MSRKRPNEDADFGCDNHQLLKRVKMEMDPQVKHDPDQENKQTTLSSARERNAMLRLYENEGNSLPVDTAAHKLMDLSVIKGSPVNPPSSAECNGQKLKLSNDISMGSRGIVKVDIKRESNSDLSSCQSDRLFMTSRYYHDSTLKVQLAQRLSPRAGAQIRPNFDKRSTDENRIPLRSVSTSAKQSAETDQVQKNETENGEDRAADNGHIYICADCDLEFPKRCALFDHIELSHPEIAVENRISVPNTTWRKEKMVCVMTLDERISISYKFYTGSKKPYVCSKCDIGYRAGCKQMLRTHLLDHFGILPFTCTSCNKKFKEQYQLTRHLEIHVEQKNHVCKICGLKFGGKGGLSQHVSEHGSFRCDDCGKEFDRKASYRVHCQFHKKGSNFLCEYCGKTFASRVVLRAHLHNHGSGLVEKQLPCLECGKTFINRRRLSNHFQATHSRNVVCDICDKRFPGLSTLKIHMVRHHQKTTPFVCEKCGKGFSTSAQLTTHSFTHTGEKPYKCKECSAGFTRSDYLRKHELTHSGEKPYLCNVCGKGFSRKSNLNVHGKWHVRIGDKNK